MDHDFIRTKKHGRPDLCMGYLRIDMKKKWKKYEVYLNSWENDWADLSTFFVYPECIRRIIYTTNSIE